jgi:pilus assembly protein Flp/PilA
MNALHSAVRQFVQDEEGITAIEYGLIAAGIAGVVGVAFVGVGEAIKTSFGAIATQLKGGT